MIRQFYVSFLMILCFLFSTPSEAAKVLKVKGKSLLLSLEGEPANVGDIFYTRTPDGRKRTGIIKITKIRGDKAIAILGKGRAYPGFGLEYRPPKGSPTSQEPTPMVQDNSPIMNSDPPQGKMYYGFLLGYAMDTMTVKLTDEDTGEEISSVGMDGNAFSVKGLFDYSLFDAVWFRGTLGLEGFKASGDAKCGSAASETCNADINYISLDMWGRYVFSKGNMRPWAGGGFSLWFPMSDSTTALESVTNTSVMAIGGGVDWFLSPRSYIPISIEYGLLPESNTVEGHLIALRAGMAFAF